MIHTATRNERQIAQSQLYRHNQHIAAGDRFQSGIKPRARTVKAEENVNMIDNSLNSEKKYCSVALSQYSPQCLSVRLGQYPGDKNWKQHGCGFEEKYNKNVALPRGKQAVLTSVLKHEQPDNTITIA